MSIELLMAKQMCDHLRSLAAHEFHIPEVDARLEQILDAATLLWGNIKLMENNPSPSADAEAVGGVTEEMVRSLVPVCRMALRKAGHNRTEMIYLNDDDIEIIVRAALKASLPPPPVTDGGWVSLAQRTPGHGVYLFYYPEGTFDECRYSESTCIAFWDDDQKVARGEYHGPVEPSHWRPLPPPPEAMGG